MLARLVRLNFVVASVTGLFLISADAAIPLQINHQGFIDVGGTSFNGNGDFRFALVDPDSGNNVWTNDASGLGTSATPTVAVSLPVINGIYNVRLGDTTLLNMTALSSPLFNDDNLELRVWFDDGTNGIEVLSPDQPLTSAPYAFHAAFSDDADTVDGAHAATLEESAEIDADVMTHDTDNGAHANIQLDGSNIATGTIANARLNTGPGNGFDADTVDGSQAATLEESAEIDSDISTHDTATGSHANIQLDGSNIATGTIANARLNTGSGNGLDADTLDGFDAADLQLISSAPASSFKNLKVEQITASTVDIDADSFVVQDASNLTYRIDAVNLTVNITTSGANGLDTGSEAADTWYYIWVIQRSSDQTVVGLLSTSSTAGGLTLPSGYDRYAIVSVVRNDGSSNFIDFLQRARKYNYNSWPVLTSGNVGIVTWVSVDTSGIVPSALSDYCYGSLHQNNGNIYITNDNSVSSNNGIAAPNRYLYAAPAIHDFYWELDILTSNTLWWLSNVSSQTIYIHGFELNRL